MKNNYLINGSVPIVTKENNLDRPGFYSLLNEKTKQEYVGSTVNVRKRANDHRFTLNNQRSKNPKLQEAFNKNSEFKLFPTFTSTKEEAQRLEQEALDKRLGDPLFLNMAFDAVTGGVLGRPMHSNTKSALFAANKGRSLSEQHKQNLKEAFKKLPPREDYSYLHTPEAREKARQANIGRKHSDETKEKIGAAHRGKKISEEQITKWRETIKNKLPMSIESKQQLSQKLSEAKKGIRLPESAYAKARACVVIEGASYNSIKEASEKLNLHRNTITKKIKKDSNCYYITKSANYQAATNNTTINMHSVP